MAKKKITNPPFSNPPFEIRRADDGQFYVVMIGVNGELLNCTETLHNHGDCFVNINAQFNRMIRLALEMGMKKDVDPNFIKDISA